jgi:hypothetical protein
MLIVELYYEGMMKLMTTRPRPQLCGFADLWMRG